MNHNHEGMHGMDMPMDTNMNMNMDTNMNMNMNMNMNLDAHTGMHHDHSGMMTMSSPPSPPSSSSSTTMEAMVDFASDTIASSGHETFCDAGMGMVMYMEGFHWTLAPPRNNNHNNNHNNKNNNYHNNHGQRNCLNLYFESWTLDTRPKFFAAMVLVVVLGIVTEGLGRWKHEVAKQQQQLQQQQQQQQSWQSRSRSERLYWTHTVLQGLSILSAYLLMLVVMTYSLELFSCVIAGLTIGYRVFGGETFRHGGGGGGGTLCCDFLRDEPQPPSQSQPPSPSQTQADSDSDSDAYTNRRVSLTERLLPRTVEPNGGTLVGATATAGTGYSYYGTNSNGHSCCSSNGSGSGSSSSSGDVDVEVVAGHDDE